MYLCTVCLAEGCSITTWGKAVIYFYLASPFEGYLLPLKIKCGVLKPSARKDWVATGLSVCEEI